MHGALWVNLKTEGEMQARAQRIARGAWLATVLLTVVVTSATFRIQPQVPAGFAARPWGWLLPAIAVFGIVCVWLALARRNERRAFLSSGLFVIGMLASAAFGIFPFVLPSNTDPSLGLTVYNTAAADFGLKIGLSWFLPGVALALAYQVYAYRHWAGKVRPEKIS
jgi:cytochrome d ubiquinol oxidase subunit II